MTQNGTARQRIEYVIGAGQYPGGDIQRVSLPFGDLVDFYQEFIELERERDNLKADADALASLRVIKRPQ